ncbi:uncharacterized protein LOC106659117 [Trichogramma pretiosum]|nr:uncharacterized protein LOC106659117 [Trichogramma pretiosum]XP_014236950.1 uncharacterized protein LOC106659117 [Trichogramma pretiosum]
MMTSSSFIQEEEIMKKPPTLVRRFSDMFKDGAYSGPPTLFSQKIRHCYQNLNLFPYLLYSFENSKSHPMAKKVNSSIYLMKSRVFEHFLFVCSNLMKTTASESKRNLKLTPDAQIIEEQKKNISVLQSNKAKFYMNDKPKAKACPLALIFAVYLAPLILALQVIGVFAQMSLNGTYTPGYLFLVLALALLGAISARVMLPCKNRKTIHRTKSVMRQKVKSN